MSNSDDQALMLRVQRGDTRPLATLFDRHHVRLYGFFRKLGHTPSDSEDLVQDTFIRMLQYAHSFRDSGKFMAWMYRIARNTAIDATRQNARRGNDDGETDALVAPRHEEPEAEHAMDELEATLQAALLQLPREKRELVLLSRVNELGNGELAELFDCSVGAIKVRLHRSLGQLREIFDRLRQDGQETSPNDSKRQVDNEL